MMPHFQKDRATQLLLEHDEIMKNHGAQSKNELRETFGNATICSMEASSAVL
ncbi:hypothetical protein DAI22_12g141300 [Oryza sativa Japonica Group]|jgi:hypothetical protein|nr:hypothetical protein DAI22_12g141300 [Oryza sativa Japonica Group]